MNYTTIIQIYFFCTTSNLDIIICYQKIESVMDDVTKIKVGLEATGHYSYNLLGYLIDKGLPAYVINPLHTNLYRKSLSLRQTKTDKADARTIASMLMSDVNLKSYAHMEKRGSRYLRYALYNATKYVCHWDPTFTAYLAKNVRKVSITILPYRTLQKNWFE